MQHKKLRRGFTLIEVLVVVLIIGILAAIALPMYNRAVLRSRFNALMPIVKAMNDSNEAYFLEHGSYASNPQDLPVQGLSEYPTGTELEFGSNMDYAYVLASNASAKNNYIMYQKHSTNYPGEIHCEAITGDDLAEYICVSAGGTTNLGTTLTEGYTTYVLSGSGAGVPTGTFEEAEDNADPMSCDKAISMGFTCTSDETTGVKKVCTTSEGTNFCRTKTYNEDGSYTSVTCIANAENVCTSNWKSATYDANGNQLTQLICARGDSDGNCTTYSNGDEYTYDENGNMLTQQYCSYFYQKECAQYSTSINYTYDANGNMLTQRYCSTVNSSGNCTTYQTVGNYDYTYDANGNMLTQRWCSSARNGNCTAYQGYNYTYDENGNMISRRACFVDSSGNCPNDNRGTNYTYDMNGNMLTQRYCTRFDSNGNCTKYDATDSYDYKYDTNGNMASKLYCSSFDSSGNCTAYSSATYYTYDDNGKQIADQRCAGDNLNTANGECIAYSSTNASAY